MSETTFRGEIEELVRDAMGASLSLPDDESLTKAVYIYHDVLGYQVMVTIGKDILEKESTDEEDGY